MSILLFVSLLLLVIALLLKTSAFQTYVAGKAADYVGGVLGTTVSIGKVNVRSFKNATFEGLYVEDIHGDTLIYARELSIDGFGWDRTERRVHIKSIHLTEIHNHVRRYADRDSTDLSILLGRITKSSEQDKQLSFVVDEFDIRDHHFTFDDFHRKGKDKGVDFDHLDVNQSLLAGNSMRFEGDSLVLFVDSLNAIESNGFELVQLGGEVHVSSRRISIDSMSLKTNASALNGQIEFTQESFSDLKDFFHSVYIRSELTDSKLNFSDIAYFSPELDLGEFELEINGRFRGNISDLKGRGVELRTGNSTILKGDLDLNGLPDLQSTFMIVDVDEFRTDRSDIARLPIPPIRRDPNKVVPEFLRRFGKIGFKGNFTGFVNAFTAYGQFSTVLGPFKTDMTFTKDTTTGFAVLDGKISSSGFKIGTALGDQRGGMIACELDLKAQGSNMTNFKAELVGKVPNIEIIGRSFENIEVQGLLEKNVFNGKLTCNDPDLNFDFDGLADLRGKWPRVDFSAFVYHADLNAMGFGQFPEGVSISTMIDAQGLIAPDSLNGSIEMRDIMYCAGADEYSFGGALLTSNKELGEPVIRLQSEIADATITGRSVPTQVPLVIKEVLHSVFPALGSGHDESLLEQDMTADITFKETDRILELLMPELSVAPGTQFQLALESKTLHLDSRLRSARLGFKDMFIGDVDAMVDKTLDMIAFSATASRSALNDSVFISDVEVRGKAYQDDLDVDIAWAGSSRNTSGDMAFLASVVGPKQGVLNVLPSEIFLGRGTWEVRDTAIVILDSTTIDFNRFTIWNGDQFVRLDGIVSKDPIDRLDYEMHDVELGQVNVFMKGPEWNGVINGVGSVTDIYGETEVYTRSSIDKLMLGNDLIGDVELSGDWNERRKRIDMEGSVSRGEIKSIDFTGWFRQGDNNAIGLQLDAENFDLSFLNAYIPEGLSDIKGSITGLVYVDGSADEPLVNGNVQLDGASLHIDFLNTTYSFSTPVSIFPDMFAADFMDIHDDLGNSGKATVSLIHNVFKDFNYDVFVQMDRMRCLNTTSTMSDLLYGQAFGTGDAMISGFGKQMDISINARSEKGTHIVFPLGDGGEVSSFEFVEFVTSDTIQKASSSVDILGIDMEMNIELTPDAFVELVFDPTVGDILSGRGNGALTLNLSRNGEMTMFGGVDVVDGEYLFTLRNLINKKFTMDEGGRISWFGDPYSAQLDLKAVYSLRAPLYDIMFDPSDAYKRRVPVDVVMQLEKSMLNPEIEFAVRLPSVDESVRTQVNSVLSTEQELNRQVFSLMVLNKFSAPASGAGNSSFESNTFAGTTGSELLSNQVSNWLSGISDALDLGVNYRPGDKVAQDELELAVSTQLFNDRLFLNSNVGLQYGDRSGAQANSLIGDFELEYLLSDDGKVRLKAFSRSNDQNLNQIDQASTTQGAGLGFREEFDNWGAFWRSLTGVFRKKE